MAVYICGDTHGDIDYHKLNTYHFPEQKQMDKNNPSDFLIICGDFGGVWDLGDTDRYIQNWYNSKPWITLFVDGNHENHDALDAMEVSEWNGGKVHKISDRIIHLMRGQVYTIEGKTYFTMGGAASIDKYWRKEGSSWWAREMPSEAEYNEGLDNLEKVNNKVNYIITHTAPEDLATRLTRFDVSRDRLTSYLGIIRETVEFDHWFFGHFHMDVDRGKYTCLYRSTPMKIEEFL